MVVVERSDPLASGYRSLSCVLFRWIDDLGQETNANRSDMNERSCLSVADDISFMLVRLCSRLSEFRNELGLVGEEFVPSGVVLVAEVDGFAVWMDLE